MGGQLADALGAKWVLAGGLSCWSLATALTPWAAAAGAAPLLVVRLALGLGEGQGAAGAEDFMVELSFKPQLSAKKGVHLHLEPFSLSLFEATTTWISRQK